MLVGYCQVAFCGVSSSGVLVKRSSALLCGVNVLWSRVAYGGVYAMRRNVMCCVESQLRAVTD